jgi:hypothetical protein
MFLFLDSRPIKTKIFLARPVPCLIFFREQKTLRRLLRQIRNVCIISGCEGCLRGQQGSQAGFPQACIFQQVTQPFATRANRPCVAAFSMTSPIQAMKFCGHLHPRQQKRPFRIAWHCLSLELCLNPHLFVTANSDGTNEGAHRRAESNNAVSTKEEPSNARDDVPFDPAAFAKISFTLPEINQRFKGDLPEGLVGRAT